MLHLKLSLMDIKRFSELCQWPQQEVNCHTITLECEKFFYASEDERKVHKSEDERRVTDTEYTNLKTDTEYHVQRRTQSTEVRRYIQIKGRPGNKINQQYKHNRMATEQKRRQHETTQKPRD